MENSLKVVSYNVRIFDRYNWQSKRISKTAEEILKLTKTLQPDILCLQNIMQDVKGTAVMEDSIVKYTGLKYRHIEYAKYKGKTKAFGLQPLAGGRSYRLISFLSKEIGEFLYL
ncbi:MAG: hypothetical protein IPF68_06425 [Bacteroidales bacterium]|nr:hypothetical protein [Bacteroidales bacterium]